MIMNVPKFEIERKLNKNKNKERDGKRNVKNKINFNFCVTKMKNKPRKKEIK